MFHCRCVVVVNMCTGVKGALFNMCICRNLIVDFEHPLFNWCSNMQL